VLGVAQAQIPSAKSTKLLITIILFVIFSPLN